MKTSPIKPQVDLLLEVLPLVSKEKSFALKGGTAINLFVRDLPRLSVDIDLTYLGNEARAEALAKVHEAVHRIKTNIERTIVGAKANPSRSQGLDADVKLFIEKKRCANKDRSKSRDEGCGATYRNQNSCSKSSRSFRG